MNFSYESFSIFSYLSKTSLMSKSLPFYFSESSLSSFLLNLTSLSVSMYTFKSIKFRSSSLQNIRCPSIMMTSLGLILIVSSSLCFVFLLYTGMENSFCYSFKTFTHFMISSKSIALGWSKSNSLFICLISAFNCSSLN